jgi:hypothetical protein
METAPDRISWTAWVDKWGGRLLFTYLIGSTILGIVLSYGFFTMNTVWVLGATAGVVCLILFLPLLIGDIGAAFGLALVLLILALPVGFLLFLFFMVFG